MKYRIIKDIARCEDEPYFPEHLLKNKWEKYEEIWVRVGVYAPVSFKRLTEAIDFIKEKQEEERIQNTPPQVVWEDEDE